MFTLRVLFLHLLTILLLLSEFAVSLPAPSDAMLSVNHANFTNILRKRQCVRLEEEGGGGYECDDLLPTLEQYVARMRDTDNGGLASPDRHAVFYSNLGVGDISAKDATAWLIAWMKYRTRKMGAKFYWWFEHVNIEWREQQAKYIVDYAEDIIIRSEWGEDPVEIWGYCNYHALSAAAVNPVAYVLLPRGDSPIARTWDTNSAWHRVEFWALTQNPNIQTIIRMDPRPTHLQDLPEEEDWCTRMNEEEVLWQRGEDEPLEADEFCSVLYDDDEGPLDTEWKDGRVQPKSDSDDDGDGDGDGEGNAQPPGA